MHTIHLNTKETQNLIARYVGYSRELWGLNVKPVPPVLFGVAKAGHSAERYMDVTLPMYAGMDPPPKVRLVQYQAGIHGYTTPEPDLPIIAVFLFAGILQLISDKALNFELG